MIDRAEALLQESRAIIEGLSQFQQTPDSEEKANQLREISRTIARLETARTTIPNELRSLKTQLVAELSVEEQCRETLESLRGGLTVLLTEVQKHVPRPGKVRKTRQKRSSQPKTDKTVLRDYIVKALKAHGGRARITEVLDWMEEHLRDRLLPGDLEKRATGEVVWHNNACWERFNLVQEGIMKGGFGRRNRY